MKISHSMPENVGKRPGRKVSKFTQEVFDLLDTASKSAAFKKTGVISLSGCDDASKVGSAARSWAASRKPFGEVKATVSAIGDTVTVYNRSAK